MRCLLLAGALSMTACGADFDHVEYAPLGEMPAGVSLEPTFVSVPVGVSVAARITAVDESGNDMNCEPDLVPEDPEVMRVEQAERGSTVFSGISPGETRIDVYCSGDHSSIAGRVTSPPPG